MAYIYFFSASFVVRWLLFVAGCLLFIVLICWRSWFIACWLLRFVCWLLCVDLFRPAVLCVVCRSLRSARGSSFCRLLCCSSFDVSCLLLVF